MIPFVFVAIAMAKGPFVINTWGGPFTAATSRAWKSLQNGSDALDAIVEGCALCEVLRCDTTVGAGGSPDEQGETTLDAMIQDGTTFDMGAVGSLRRIPNAIQVARAVMDYTEHTLLVGDQATSFAIAMGFAQQNLSSKFSIQKWTNWTIDDCQPNFRQNVQPNASTSCGPYTPALLKKVTPQQRRPRTAVDRFNHDTIAMIVRDDSGKIVAGTSTNGASFKLPGRVGDAAIPGAGAFADSEVGGCGETGDGDVMMRFLPCQMIVGA
jgi:N4-(beta-N-acetylglucosaminyl)-L-asparaginase